MIKQKVPDIEFGEFVFGQIGELFLQEKIKINEEYQRGSIWKYKQKIELIRSIENRYSIGVLVLFVNGDGQYEILDGQQRLLVIKEYVTGNLDLTNTGVKKYSDLDPKEKILMDAYCIYYLKIKSFGEESREEDITQTFLRLQEGTPLNKAEKINAYRGKFKDNFRELRDKHQLFTLLGKEKLFGWRLLAAEFLLLELESDFEKKEFPSLDIQTFDQALNKYAKIISPAKIQAVKGNLDILNASLNVLLTGIQSRELVTFYLLLSYLRKRKADNTNLVNEFGAFAEEFLFILNSFSIYHTDPPKGWKHSVDVFRKYVDYKNKARQATSSDSLKTRFDFALSEYSRLLGLIEKDPKRFFDIEQKRTLFFEQKGLCGYCKKQLDFRSSTADHEIQHGKGGKTDLTNASLLHERCHKQIEKGRKNQR